MEDGRQDAGLADLATRLRQVKPEEDGSQSLENIFSAALHRTFEPALSTSQINKVSSVMWKVFNEGAAMTPEVYESSNDPTQKMLLVFNESHVAIFFVFFGRQYTRY